ncbi:acyltransferase domain-containing protein [Streptomyces sp. GbtcB6]|uniref:acyltransferase domain-containing protein n=1 Tax=Streptomyces sp. GbtcB6 TaxID=2824751 RepID=UPI001C2FE1E5|nr:acyltransferase domain-containing protein [Streptomyces sp. GbtcB6]
MLPDADDLPDLLLDLAVPHEDINDLVALRRAVTADPGLRRLLEEGAEDVTGAVREVDDPAGLADRAAQAPEALGEYFLVYVFLMAVPHARAVHRARGIPDDVSRHTLADLGRGMALHRRRIGRGGLAARQAHWLTRHFCGRLYQLGRLQYERTWLGDRTAQAIKAAGTDVTGGEPSLDLHIPDFLGPLTPVACDRSVDRAREFFARHFPEEPHTVATCHSWLLDPQLRQHLPAGSNIVRFQERFRPGWVDPEPSDTTPVGFVFGDPDLPVRDLPRRTSVERAVGDHLRAGGHWYVGHGWFPWDR